MTIFNSLYIYVYLFLIDCASMLLITRRNAANTKTIGGESSLSPQVSADNQHNWLKFARASTSTVLPRRSLGQFKKQSSLQSLTSKGRTR